MLGAAVEGAMDAGHHPVVQLPGIPHLAALEVALPGLPGLPGLPR